MLKYYSTRNLLFLFSILAASSCSEKVVSINTIRPAEITFPSYVNTLVLVDRTKFEKQSTNIIEAVLTGELPGEDKAGLQEAMSRFQQQLMASPRFQLKSCNEILVGNSITNAMPNPLPWSKIESICQAYQAEAVVAIEVFDTDFFVTNGKRKIKRQIEENGVKKEIEVDEFYAEGLGSASIGFRVYDPKAKQIVDQQLYKKTNSWQATGVNAQDAVLHLLNKQDATRHVSGIAGPNYAAKITPLPITISRAFYGKAKNNQMMGEGIRLAEVNKWSDAVSTWERAIGGSSVEDAGKICYNIAIGYEVLGDLSQSKYWASRSYVKYGNKKARDYSASLDYRMNQQKIVEQQMR